MDNKTTDPEFYKIFAIITAIIVLLTIIIAILSKIFASYSTDAHENYKSELQSLSNIRTEPTGKINLASNPSIKQEIIVAAKTNLTPKSGEEVYNAVCMSCHTSGAAGAPMIGNSSQWSDRLAKGKDQLYLNAINGIGIMPAKGGVTSLSDDEVNSAVDYILSKTN
tara:strand:+ start:120 stop:617 length:498 start_codon:yes stop_codon:yes gene_type:complete